MALRYCLKIGKPDEAIFKQLLKAIHPVFWKKL
jgi:hypothetical protein